MCSPHPPVSTESARRLRCPTGEERGSPLKRTAAPGLRSFSNNPYWRKGPGVRASIIVRGQPWCSGYFSTSAMTLLATVANSRLHSLRTGDVRHTGIVFAPDIESALKSSPNATYVRIFFVPEGVDDFVAARAHKINKDQRRSLRGCNLFNINQFRTTKVLKFQ